MCQETREPITHDAGYGYKVVKLEKTGFSNLFKWFRNNGIGYLDGPKSDTVEIYIDIVYALYKTTTVNPTRRIPFTFDEGSYPAGIHLYRSLEDALHEKSYYEWTAHIAVIKCHYRRVVAENGDTVVALEVTPVEVMG